ncbi:XRE family transcriptional regulator [Nitratireductor indicus C115]|uniref:XRE family transcriptional regulator n=1 Tax=Nitratireductor indicus C115 TaxID=1231190 RepID=K2PAB4_9HYPH|nr:helix-turn-helix domain-containing protein [Nitratireductor indicus]EKF44081.1 XRE family transcriptional regulator [Nitratireductor indicus C115]SFQ82326.1 putative transcriptional regulator [Nitratireductor indicus]
MSKKVFDQIAEGMNEALAVARGTAKPRKLHVPAEIDIKAIRKALGLSQEDFAAEFFFSISQIRDWEQGRSRPLDNARVYLLMIAKNPKLVRKMLEEIRQSNHDDDNGSMAAAM